MQLPQFLLRRVRDMADNLLLQQPDKVIGSHYLSRWYVIPRNRLFNIYLHHVVGNDPDENLHDHPWLFNASLVLKGEIFEELPNRERVLADGSLTARMGRSPHRLVLRSQDSLTLFLTGPKVRRWGFYTAKGWIDSKHYLRRGGNGRDVQIPLDTPAES